ncbi:MAG: sigma-70 family RNA polymerase sigma factor [Gemmatimonadota bacterium]
MQRIPSQPIPFDDDAFPILVPRADLVLIAYGVLHDRDAAEDVVHDVICSLLARPVSLITVPAPYLCTAVRNHPLKTLGQQRRRTALLSSAHSPLRVDEAFSWQPERIDQELLFDQVVAEIHFLPPRAREIATLHWLNGLSVGEIAHRLGASRKSVEKRITYARKTLLSHVETPH